jgi:PleD family two-component response regulator
MLRVSQRREWQVTLSVGVVTCGGARPSVDALLEQADRLMYEVKSSAKNGARFGVCAA